MASHWWSLYPRVHNAVGGLSRLVERPQLVQKLAFSSITDKNDSATATAASPTLQVTKTSTLGAASDDPEKQPRRRRRRTSFGADSIDSIPSFQDFQQQQAVRNQYRQFMRLVRPLAASPDLKQQIRREFRHTAATDSWQVKRALSEGNRRFKDLSAMLGNQVKAMNPNHLNDTDIDNNDDYHTPKDHKPTSQTAWPWQQAGSADSRIPSRPARYPSKSTEILK
jgi:hypothetical protein